MGDLFGLDRYLFELINVQGSNSFFDVVMPILREKLFWAPFYVFLLTYALVNLRKNKWYFIMMLFVTVSMADLTSSELIKKTVQRPRPCQELVVPDINVLVHCGGGYSFTSSHAANHFAVAVFLMFTIFKQPKWLRYLLFLWAFSISYAQVYVGVHYPLDIFGGALVGVSYGLVMAWLYEYFFGGD